MTAALKAGTTYFATVFAVGFVLGTVRVLLLLPFIGEAAAVFFEIPIILVASWIAARWTINRFDVSGEVAARLMMGAFAFALLILGELAVSGLLFGRPLQDTLDAYRSLPGAGGLFAQVIFALLPVAQAMLLRKRDSGF